MSRRIIGPDEAAKNWLRQQVEGTLLGRTTIAGPNQPAGQGQALGRSALPSTTVIEGGSVELHHVIQLTSPASRTIDSAGSFLSWVNVGQRVGFAAFTPGEIAVPLSLTGNHTVIIGFEWGPADHGNGGGPFTGGGLVEVAVDGTPAWPLMGNDPLWQSGAGNLFQGVFAFHGVRGQTVTVKVTPPSGDQELRRASLIVRSDGSSSAESVPSTPGTPSETDPAHLLYTANTYIATINDDLQYNTGWPSGPWGITAAFSNDGTRIAIATRGWLRILNALTREWILEKVLPPSNNLARKVVWSPNDSLIAVAFTGPDGGLMVFDGDTYETQGGWPLPPGSYAVLDAQFSPDGSWLALGTNAYGGGLVVVSTTTKTIDTSWPSAEPTYPSFPKVAWSHDGELLAFTAGRLGGGQQLRVINVASKTIDTGWADPTGVYSMKWSPDSSKLAMQVRVGDTRFGAVVLRSTKQFDTGWDTVIAPTDSTRYGLAWRADGAKLAFTTPDSGNAHRVLDVATKTIDAAYPQAGSLPVDMGQIQRMYFGGDPGGLSY